jgi:glycosyltransferase involved in cell wall biosynthesis
MKILFGMPSKDSWGGVVVTETPFVEAVKKLDVEVVEDVYVYGDKEKPTPFFERVRRVLRTAFRFRKTLKKDNFDLIHLNTAFDLKAILRDSFSIFVMNPKKAKIFLKMHGTAAEEFAGTNFAVRFLINYLAKRVNGFGIHSVEELNNFKRLGFEEKKFYFEKNAVVIDEDLFATFPRRQKSGNEPFELLFASRFIPTKGALETIRACAVLRDQGVNFILHCIGDGEIKNEVTAEVEKLGLHDHVKLPGYMALEELTKYFFKTDLFVFPTRHKEGFPMVLFKAVAVGMPIVTTEIRAGAVHLKDRENCLFCTPEPEDIAEKIIQLIENQELRQTMSENNLAFGQTLRPEKIAQEFLEIYRRVIDG